MTLVHISIDMEGIAGIATRRQVTRGSDDYPLARRLMTDEANAAVGGAFSAGASRVIVSDAHGDMSNLLPDRMDPRAELLIGSPKVPWGMMQGIAEEPVATIFVGYHAAAGTTNATLEHTFSSATLTELSVNGETWSETRFNAAIAGLFGVPVALIAGDDLACAQAREFLPSVHTVVVKTAVGREVVSSMHPAQACHRIEKGVSDAIQHVDELDPYRPDGPYTLEAGLLSSVMAEACTMLPGTTRAGARGVRFTCDDIVTLKQAVSCWIALAGSAS